LKKKRLMEEAGKFVKELVEKVRKKEETLDEEARQFIEEMLRG